MLLFSLSLLLVLQWCSGDTPSSEEKVKNDYTNNTTTNLVLSLCTETTHFIAAGLV